ncbi:MAG: alpha/beta fold hydrolase [Archangium sp.]|nr:alpha/beta fold hydrolase [Archangium sp.]MDP3572790.1 alpha/beta fold hydrolase [Archangium sp.]
MHTEIAGLSVEVFQATQTAPSAAVILCHGFGAPGDDLVGLAPELASAVPALRDVRFYFPAAPLTLEMGFGDSRAWWLIDMGAVQKLAHDPAAQREFRRKEPEGMPAARKALLALVQDVAAHTGLPMKKIILGGFSQGAMIATDVALRLEEAPGGLCVLSGTLLIEDAWKQKAKARAGLPVFQSHGRQDPILPYVAAEWLKELFLESGMEHEFVPFDGGHTIGPQAFTKLGAFLAQQVTR